MQPAEELQEFEERSEDAAPTCADGNPGVMELRVARLYAELTTKLINKFRIPRDSGRGSFH